MHEHSSCLVEKLVVLFLLLQLLRACHCPKPCPGPHLLPLPVNRMCGEIPPAVMYVLVICINGSWSRRVLRLAEVMEQSGCCGFGEMTKLESLCGSQFRANAVLFSSHHQFPYLFLLSANIFFHLCMFLLCPTIDILPLSLTQNFFLLEFGGGGSTV